MNAAATKERITEYADGLRALADWIETTELPICKYSFDYTLTNFSVYLDDPPEVGAAIKMIGGNVKKDAFDSSFYLKRKFGGGVSFSHSMEREAICTPVTKTVEEDVEVVVDLKEYERLQAKLGAMPRTIVKREVDVTEWQCPPSLLALESNSIDEPVPSEQIEDDDQEIPF